TRRRPCRSRPRFVAVPVAAVPAASSFASRSPRITHQENTMQIKTKVRGGPRGCGGVIRANIP
ncbi:hypothetical protein ACLESO_01310, partial [Pyxidicoccus sp. 3LG]